MKTIKLPEISREILGVYSDEKITEKEFKEFIIYVKNSNYIYDKIIYTIVEEWNDWRSDENSR